MSFADTQLKKYQPQQFAVPDSKPFYSSPSYGRLTSSDVEDVEIAKRKYQQEKENRKYYF